MYQQQLDLRPVFSEQLSFELDVPENQQPQVYVDTSKFTAIDGSFVGTINSFLNVNNSDGGVMARIDDAGLSIKMENQSWLKTKVANWLGVKYL
tara:strand:- start:2410 stop:2691 length:282 start_codon:yes stop_codon:yes gene_type:complete